MGRDGVGWDGTGRDRHARVVVHVPHWDARGYMAVTWRLHGGYMALGAPAHGDVVDVGRRLDGRVDGPLLPLPHLANLRVRGDDARVACPVVPAGVGGGVHASAQPQVSGGGTGAGAGAGPCRQSEAVGPRAGGMYLMSTIGTG